jgi:hypothetical protein
MTASNLTRRTMLRASVAAVAIATPAGALAATPADDGPMLALESRWRTALADKARTYAEWRAIHDSLPPHAQAELPNIPVDGAGGLFPRSFAARTITLANLRAFNSRAVLDDIAEWGSSKDRLARIIAEGDAREEWWIATYRDGQRLQAAAGLDAANERDEAAYEVLARIEDEIMAAPADTFDGIRIKLAILARASFVAHSNDKNEATPREEWEWTDLAVYDLSAEAERISGRAQA